MNCFCHMIQFTKTKIKSTEIGIYGKSLDCIKKMAKPKFIKKKLANR